MRLKEERKGGRQMMCVKGSGDKLGGREEGRKKVIEKVTRETEQQ